MTSRPAEAQHLRDLARLRRVRDRMDREYAQPLDVEALARGVHMSAGHLSREFRLAYGESPYSYLMTRRIERAMALLRRGDLSVTEVCFAVGCSSLGTFSTRFTELVGVPPSVYRREGVHSTDGHAGLRGEAGDETDQESRSGGSRAATSVSGMNLSIHTTVLPHDDPDASVAFYRDVLGFEVRSDFGQGRMRWITVGPPDQPDTCLLLAPPAADPGVTDDERRTIVEMMAKGTYGWILLATNDLDGTFERVQASDAEVVQEPTEQPYGVRDCAFRDPAGNQIRIQELVMKTMTCRQLGGACDLPLRGETADEVIKAQDKHLKEAVAAGDTDHEDGAERHEGPLEAPGQGDGLVQEHQARVRRAARGLTAPTAGTKEDRRACPRSRRRRTTPTATT